jgi:hypothetical protein
MSGEGDNLPISLAFGPSNSQQDVPDLNIITDLELLGLTSIYDPAIDKSSVGAIEIGNHDLTIVAQRYRTVDSRYAGVIQPDCISGYSPYIQGSASARQTEVVLMAIL